MQAHGWCIGRWRGVDCERIWNASGEPVLTPRGGQGAQHVRKQPQNTLHVAWGRVHQDCMRCNLVPHQVPRAGPDSLNGAYLLLSSSHRDNEVTLARSRLLFATWVHHVSGMSELFPTLSVAPRPEQRCTMQDKARGGAREMADLHSEVGARVDAGAADAWSPIPTMLRFRRPPVRWRALCFR
jgi:hypothetical protein